MEVVASLSQGRTAAAQCGLFTHKSVPVIFEPPCTIKSLIMLDVTSIRIQYFITTFNKMYCYHATKSYTTNTVILNSNTNTNINLLNKDQRDALFFLNLFK